MTAAGTKTGMTCFPALLGQERALRLLSRSLDSGRLAHAYLFRGPDGLGKRLAALRLAARLNCIEPTGLEPCGRCRSCVRYLSGNHPDFQVIAPEKGTIRIARVRELIAELSYPPYESGLRVVVLEDVHTMRREAANSLLKTLEEPPPGNLLILTADQGRELLDTIRSRCQVIPFHSLKEEECLTILGRALPDQPRDALALLARLAEGSPGRALRLEGGGLLELRGRLVELLTDPTAIEDAAVGRVLRLAEDMAALAEDLPELLALLRLWLRDSLLTGEGEGNRWNVAAFFVRVGAVDRAEQELGRQCNRTLVCEMLLFALLDAGRSPHSRPLNQAALV